jgi:hypothetical protein
VPRFATLFAIGLLFGLSVALQAARDARVTPGTAARQYLYLPSGGVVRRLTGAFDTLAADVYWIRAIQHYGGTKLSTSATKQYDLLHPLLDITTTLDPHFNVAYRFGAIFLAEQYPGGAGRPDLAVKLLQKGFAANSGKWQYLQDIGFIYYWWVNDYETAAEWFRKAADVPGAPWWMRSLAATTLAQGGDRESSRLMWRTIGASAVDNDWLKAESEKRLLQLDALDMMDALAAAIERHMQRTGAFPTSWGVLVRAGLIEREPVDPTGVAFVLDPVTRSLNVSTASRLFPLPTEPSGAPPTSSGPPDTPGER